MSKIKVNSLEGVGASTPAITIDNVSGTCTANITNNLSNRNLVINGAMQVAQRGTAASTTVGLGSVDRFKLIGAGLSNTFSQQQISLTSSDTPYSSGFRKAFRISQNQAGTAANSGAVDFSHYIEAQNVAGSGWNYTSASSKITLQFWFRASTNQTFYGFLLSSDGTVQRNTFSFTASGNDTWTKVTKTFTGNSNITINNDNGTGLIVYLVPYYGTNYQGSVSLDTWTALANNEYVPTMASTWLTAGASTFDVTGMQLEVGSVATDFEHRSFSQELALCQRYYYDHANGNNAQNNNRAAICSGGMYNSSNFFGVIQFPVKMRTRPSLVKTTGTDYYRVYGGNVSDGCNDAATQNWSDQAFVVNLYDSLSLTQGSGGWAETNNASALIAFNAEL